MDRYQCPGCGYVYDERKGDEHEGFSPGTRWEDVPAEWACADCAVRDKADFVKLESPSET
jgi:rubredoxin